LSSNHECHGRYLCHGLNSEHPANNRRTYSAIVNSTTKRNYRADLRKDAVAKASAIRRSQRAVKESKPTKVRGAKAKAAAEKA
jgi:large subunit ribosomal protein L28e